MSIGTEVFIKLLAIQDPNLKATIDAMLAEMGRLNQASAAGGAAGPSPAVAQTTLDVQAQIAMFNNLAAAFKNVQTSMTQAALTGSKEQLELTKAAFDAMKAQDEQLTAEVIKNATLRRQAQQQGVQGGADRMNDRLDVATARADGDKKLTIQLRADQMVAAAQRVGAEQAKIDDLKKATDRQILKSGDERAAKEQAAANRQAAALDRRLANERVLTDIINLRTQKAYGTPEEIRAAQQTLTTSLLERQGARPQDASGLAANEASAAAKKAAEAQAADAKKAGDAKALAEAQVAARIETIVNGTTAYKRQKVEEEVSYFRAKGVEEIALAQYKAARFKEIDGAAAKSKATPASAGSSGETSVEVGAGRVATAAADAKNALGELHTTAMNTGIAFTALAVPLGLIGHEMINQVIKFDTYRAKLQTAMHDSVAAEVEVQKAVQMAMTTPFEVSSVVDASAKLRIFHQDADRLLPLAGDLAAAMGKDINEAANALGKAMEGSASGVRELTNTFGISRVQLREHGAVMSKHGQILLQNRDQINKFREAVIAIIETNYGGGMERLMTTVSGALSNLYDVWHNAWRKIGESMGPTAIAITKNLTGLMRDFTELPTVVTSSIGMFVAAGTAIASTGAASAGAIAILSRLGASFPAAGAAATLLTTNVGVAGQAIFGVSRIANSATVSIDVLKAAFLGFVTNPMTIAVAALAVAGGLLIKNLADREAASVKMGATLTEQSKAVVNASNGWKEYVAIMDEVSGGTLKAANSTLNMAEQIENLKRTAKSVSPADLARIFGRAGKSAEDVTREGQEARKNLETAEGQRKALQPAMDAFSGLKPDEAIVAETGSPGVFGDGKAYAGGYAGLPQATKDAMAAQLGEAGISHRDLISRSRELDRIIANLRGRAEGAETVAPILHGVETNLGEVGEGEKGAQRMLRYTEKDLPGAMSPQQTLQTMKDRSATMQGGLVATGLPATVQDAQKFLLKDSHQDNALANQQKAVQSWLDIQKMIATQQKQIDTDAATAQKEKFQDTASHFQQLKALGQMSLDDEVAMLKRQIGNIKGTDKESNSERLTLRRQLASSEVALDKERTDALLHSADEAKKEGIADAHGNNQAEIQAYARHYWTLEAELHKHGAHKKEILEAQRQDRIAIHKAKEDDAKQYQENLAASDVKASKRYLHELEKRPDVSSDVKIAATKDEQQKAQQALETMRARGYEQSVIDKQAERVADLKTHADELHDAQLKAILADEKAILEVRKQSLNHDIQANRERLKAGETKTKSGEDLEQKLADDIRKRLSLELEAIDKAAHEKLLLMGESAENEKRVNEEVAHKKKAAIDDEFKTVKEIQAERIKAEDAIEAKKAATSAKHDSSRVGGPQSPMYGAEEDSELAADQGGKPVGRMPRFSMPKFSLSLPDASGSGPNKSGNALANLATELNQSTTNLNTALRDSTNKNVDAMASLRTALNGVTNALHGTPTPDAKGPGGAAKSSEPYKPPDGATPHTGNFGNTIGYTLPDGSYVDAKGEKPGVGGDIGGRGIPKRAFDWQFEGAEWDPQLSNKNPWYTPKAPELRLPGGFNEPPPPQRKSGDLSYAGGGAGGLSSGGAGSGGGSSPGGSGSGSQKGSEQPSIANVTMDIAFNLGGEFGSSLDQTESDLLRRAATQIARNRVNGLEGV